MAVQLSSVPLGEIRARAVCEQVDPVEAEVFAQRFDVVDKAVAAVGRGSVTSGQGRHLPIIASAPPPGQSQYARQVDLCQAAGMPTTNWAGNVTFRAARTHRPESVDALRRIVADAGHIRAIGTAHSFSRVADTTHDLVGLDGLPP